MATLQRIKQLPLVKNDLGIWFANLLLSFLLGIPYYFLFILDVKQIQLITFHDVLQAFWISVLAFIGAPSVYSALREQTLVNAKPKTRKEIALVNDVRNDLSLMLDDPVDIMGNEQ